MKRFSCLSAILVGLSVTTASFAAPEATAPAAPKATKAKRVAQGDEPAPPPAPAPDTQPAPAEPPPAAPAEPPSTGPETTPGVSLSTTTTPGADTPSSSAAEEPQKKPERRWSGSAITGYTSMTTATVFKGQTQYNDPTVDSSIWLMPRYNINEAFQLRGRIIFSYEYTNSDTTVTKNEPRFSDTSVQLVYRKLPEFATIKPLVGIQVAAPTSPESRARTMIFSPGALAGLSKTFKHVGSGQIDVAVSTVYSHPIYQSENAEVRGQRPYALQCAGGTDCQDLLSGTLNPSDTLSYTLSVGGKWGKWSPSLYFLGASQWVYHPNDDATVPIAGGQQVSPIDPPDFERSSVRQSGYFAASVDYEFLPWLTGEVGYSLYRNILTEDGKYGNPIWDRYQDMRVFIGATVDPDEFIHSLTGKNETGVTHARAKRPVMTY